MFQEIETASKLEKLATKLGLDNIPQDLTDESGKLINGHRVLPLEQKGTYNGQEWRVKDFLEFIGFDTENMYYRDNGRTRAVFEAPNKSLGVEETVKVTFPPLGLNSVATQINLTNSGVNDNKLKNNEESRHHTNTKSRFVFDNGIEITVEKRKEGRSIEELVRFSHLEGLGEYTTSKILKDIINIVYFYNIRKNTLIRDITAGNFMFDEKEVTLVDRQNAIKEQDAWREQVPTRGGTQYTHPHILLMQYEQLDMHPSSFPTNKKATKFVNAHSRSDKRTEVYSLGALTYYMLTGQHIFDYKLDFATKDEIASGVSKQIRIKDIEDSKVREIVLKDGDELIDGIDIKRHNKKLKLAVKELPSEYRKLVYGSMSIGQKKEFRDISEFETEFMSKGVPLAKQILQRAYDTSKGVVWAVGIGLIFSGAIFMDRCSRDIEPSIYEINQLKSIAEFRHLDVSKEEIARMYNVLENSIMKHEDRVLYFVSNGEFGRQWNENIPPQLSFMLARRTDIETRSSIKIRKAIAYTCVLSDTTAMNEYYDSIGEDRSRQFYVSREWFFQTTYSKEGLIDRKVDETLGYEEYNIARFIANRLEVDKLVEETIVRYYLPTTEIDRIKLQSGTSNYFDAYNDSTETFIPGYRHKVPEVIRETIDLTIAMYHLSDENGDYHCQVADHQLTGINSDIKGFAQHLNEQHDFFKLAKNYHTNK